MLQVTRGPSLAMHMPALSETRAYNLQLRQRKQGGGQAESQRWAMYMSLKVQLPTQLLHLCPLSSLCTVVLRLNLAVDSSTCSSVSSWLCCQVGGLWNTVYTTVLQCISARAVLSYLLLV